MYVRMRASHSLAFVAQPNQYYCNSHFQFTISDFGFAVAGQPSPPPPPRFESENWQPPKASNLVLWLDATDRRSMLDSANPTTWADLSPQGNHVALYGVTTVSDGTGATVGVNFPGYGTSYGHAAAINGIAADGDATVIVYHRPATNAAVKFLLTWGRNGTQDASAWSRQLLLSQVRGGVQACERERPAARSTLPSPGK